jgi:SAM-dependent methyltransferase
VSERFYSADLAHVHDAAFGEIARAGAAELIERLRRAGHHEGLVVDLGCGSGITAAALTQAGYDVLGVDVSPDLLALARRRAPDATFVEGSAFAVELPPAVAVAALGEVLGYDATGDVPGLLARARDALQDGGLLLFDLAEPGREDAEPRRTWHAGRGWVLCLEAAEHAGTLRRSITVFREDGTHYRRTDELHTLRLRDRAEILAALDAAGFAPPEILGGYAALQFPPGLTGYAATAPAASPPAPRAAPPRR